MLFVPSARSLKKLFSGDQPFEMRDNRERLWWHRKCSDSKPLECCCDDRKKSIELSDSIIF